YNTLDKPFTSTDEDQLSIILQAVSQSERNGIATPPHIIALQEQRRFSFTDSTAQRFADELNTLGGVTSYEVFASGFGDDLLMYVYDSAVVDLIGTQLIFSEGPRPTVRAQFRPVGYDVSPETDLYLYNSHLKAGSTFSDVLDRDDEATAVRANADALGQGANAIYLGDFNFQEDSEPGYQAYIAAGPGQALDPIALASWPNSGVAEHLTQSTRTASLADGGAAGGLDDRFDFQLVTGELLDGEGLSYIGPTAAGMSATEHSYDAFGNDGVSFNTRINNTSLGRSQPLAVLNALHNFSDHLPVIADYQVPAVLGVELGEAPGTLTVGEAFTLSVTVTNDASVVAAIGADELDYTISTTGDFANAGTTVGSELALSAGTTYGVVFDTSVAGLMSGTIEIDAGASPGAANALVSIPISFEVVAAQLLAGDYNGDGLVNGADYALFRNTLGTPAADAFAPGSRDPSVQAANVVAADLAAVLANFTGGAADAGAVAAPAPGSALLLIIGATVNAAARRRTAAGGAHPR
ncbi:MAG: hypothetical protein AAF790_15450, partial [Planctomycetota bacterium]